MQMDQLFEFVYILIDKKQVTAKEMACHFGVSTRTVYRWIDALSLSGVPVYSTRGNGGGISISEKYTLDKTMLSEDERLAIVSSVKAFNSLSGNSKSNEMAGNKAVEKISRLAPSETNWLEVDFAPWSPEGNAVRELFALLRDSILKKHQVIFDYFSGNGKSEKRTVHPWKLIYKGQAWYLKGWCTIRKDVRFFKLSRIRNASETKRPATVTQENTAEKPLHEKNQVSAPAAPLIKIKAKVSAEKLPYLLDTFMCSELTKYKDGTALATFTIPDADWIFEMLLSFGANLKIISPKSVREKVISLAEGIIKLYKN